MRHPNTASSVNPNGHMPVKATLERDSFSFPVIAATITEAICRSFNLEITCHCTNPQNRTDFILHTWRFSLEDAHGDVRAWIGKCSSFTQEQTETGTWKIYCQLESLLHQLKQGTVHLRADKEVPLKDWVSALLMRHVIESASMQWHFDCRSIRPRIVQVLQNDYDCLIKLTAQENIVIWQSTDKPVIHFVNAPEQLNYCSVERLFFVEKEDLLQSGGEQIGAFELEDIFRFAITPEEYWDSEKHWEDQHPVRLYSGIPCLGVPGNQAGTVAKPFKQFKYDAQSLTALCASQHITIKEQGQGYRYFTAKSNAIALKAGHWVNVVDVAKGQETRCLIRYVKHHLLLWGKSLRYHNELILQPSNAPWRAVSPPKTVLPLLMEARIQGNHESPLLNDRGEEHVIFQGNLSDEKTILNVPRIRPYVSPDGGFNFPLHDQTRVLISFLYGEMDLPVIVGVMPEENISGIQSDPFQHVISTRGGQQLCMNDDPANLGIALQLSPHHGLIMENGQSQGISLQSAGLLSISAGQNITQKTSGSWNAVSKKEAILSARTSQRVKSLDGNISLIAKKSIKTTIQKNLLIESGQDLEIDHKHFNLKSGEFVTVNAKDGDFKMIFSGEVSLKSGKNMIIESDEKIVLMSGDGKVSCVIDREGITFSADEKFEINAEKIALKGKVNFGSGEKHSTEHVSSHVHTLSPKNTSPASTNSHQIIPLVFHQIAPRQSALFYGKPIKPGELGDLYFSIAPVQCTFEDVLNSVYENPSDKHRSHFVDSNPHLAQQIQPGQIFYIVSEQSRAFQTFKADLIESARKIESHRSKIPASEAPQFTNHFALYGSFAESVGQKEGEYRSTEDISKQRWGMTTGVADAFFGAMKSHIQQLADAYQQHPKGQALKAMREQAVKNMDRMTASFCDRLVKGGQLTASTVVDMGLRAQHTLHRWVPTTWRLAPLDELYRSVTVLHGAAKLGGISLIALDFNDTQEKISTACEYLSEEACTRETVEEWGGFTGRIVAGAGIPRVVGAGMAIVALKIAPAAGPISIALASTGVTMMVNGVAEEHLDKLGRNKFLEFYEYLYSDKLSEMNSVNLDYEGRE